MIQNYNKKILLNLSEKFPIEREDICNKIINILELEMSTSSNLYIK